jgi:hypothetical protein
MRWLSGVRGAWVVLTVFLAACGSGGNDELTLAFQGFSGAGITQSDAVNPNSADVDVCQFLCLSGQNAVVEPYTQTRINALFVNRGKADIVLDDYVVSVPGSGVADQQRFLSARIPGGRCANNAQQECAFDDECIGAACTHEVTSVEILLFDFNFKSLVVDGQCPTLEDPFGSVISRTLTTNVTFSGEDETSERRTISASYSATFDNFNSCNQ